MESIIIHSDSKKDLSLLQQLAEKMGLKTHVLTQSEKEDIAIAKAINENRPSETLLKEDAMKYYDKLDKAE